ncbi:MAG: glycosyltransferase, partial [Myxococcales bacterium]|nr:glycosyltransferase [Myxococcales bacterium]
MALELLLYEAGCKLMVVSETPRVSVVICNYNYGRFLNQAIKSVLEQDYPEIEVVVVDDGSTDNSRDIIDQWGSRIISCFKENGGQVSGYNTGFQRTTGDIIIFLDADDYLELGAISTIVCAFTPETVKVHYRMRMVDENSYALGPVFPKRIATGDVSSLLRDGVLYASSPGSGNAYRRSSLCKLMPLPKLSQDPHGADFYTIYGISLLGEVTLATEQPLANYRVHQLSSKNAVWGNAASKAKIKEPERSYRRYANMRKWLYERLGSRGALPEKIRDFSLEKQGYAQKILDSQTYVEQLRVGGPYLVRHLIPALARREDVYARLALGMWGVLVLVLPKPIGRPLMVYVCNPS